LEISETVGRMTDVKEQKLSRTKQKIHLKTTSELMPEGLTEGNSSSSSHSSEQSGKASSSGSNFSMSSSVKTN